MSFQTGLSGLAAASRSLDVIGNNIANASTPGMKSSRAEFSNLVASAIGTGAGSEIGIGVEVATVAQMFTQGTITTTGNDLDVAINGGGFFQLTMPDGTPGYTRAGNFSRLTQMREHALRSYLLTPEPQSASLPLDQARLALDPLQLHHALVHDDEGLRAGGFGVLRGLFQRLRQGIEVHPQLAQLTPGFHIYTGIKLTGFQPLHHRYHGIQRTTHTIGHGIGQHDGSRQRQWLS